MEEIKTVIIVFSAAFLVKPYTIVPPNFAMSSRNRINGGIYIMETVNENGMSRREACKRMGMFIAGAAVSSMGLTSLSSCSENPQKKRIILYFTATGNSLYIARQLTETKEQLLSIPQMMKEGRYEFEADEIGLIYPIYGHMPPNMVRRFIKKAKLKAAYKFAILTFGARKCNAVEIWDGVSTQAGNKFDYIATIMMVDNWLPNFDMNVQKKMDKHIPENLRRITADIDKRRRWHEPVSDEERQMHAGFMFISGIDPEVGFLKRSEKCFTVTKNCTGCASCVNVCPHGNFKIVDNKAVMEGDCDFCFACIQNCPQKAIRFRTDSGDPLLARGEVNPNARYRNEHISLTAIKRSNTQLTQTI